MDDWPVGLSTGCFYQQSFFSHLERIREAGFSRIEICSYPAHLDYHDRPLVRRAAARLRELDLEPFSFHAPFGERIDITAPDPGERRHSVEEILRAAEAAALMGARHLVLHPGPEKHGLSAGERPARLENAAAALHRVALRCRELGLRLVLENMLPHLFLGAAGDLLGLLGGLDGLDVGLCLDTGHAFLSGDLHGVVHQLAGRLLMIHASDNRGTHDDHLPPGEGFIPWPGLAGHLAAAGFRGTLIIELAQRGTPEEILRGAGRGRDFLRGLAL
jgi:sugar phosphate isomerase/epimerase